MVFFSVKVFSQQADFTADKVSGCIPLTVNFSDLSTGTVNGWEWDFGNGNSSTLKNPSTIYTQAGTYTVKLKAKNGGNPDEETKTAFIVVHSFPDVKFSFDETMGCGPLSVGFTDGTTSDADIAEWLWVFGDGGTSNNQNPTHQYTSKGVFSISLKVTNEFGCAATKISETSITVFKPDVLAQADNPVQCNAPAIVNFSSQTSSPTALTYHWNFGDGSESTSPTPQHTFNDIQQYDVTLTVTDTYGCSSSDDITIIAGGEGGLSITPSAAQVCSGTIVDFIVVADDAIESYEWDFGNGTISGSPNANVLYTEPGEYTVTLKAQLDGKTCASIATTKVKVNGVLPNFTSTVNCNLIMTLTSTTVNAQSIEWYIKDEFYSSANQMIYPATAGDVEVELRAIDNSGCTLSKKETIHVAAPPTASFLPDLEQSCENQSLSGCAPFSLTFENTTQSELTFTSAWTFGDGRSSTQKNPSITYTNAGSFNVKLTVTNSKNCKSTFERKVTVSSTTPVAAFSAAKTSACVKENIPFTDQSTNANFWCWDFGDGSFSSEKNPQHAYMKAGIYTVRLTAKNAGCSDTKVIDNMIEIKEPTVEFEVTKNCVDPFSIGITNLSVGTDSIQWELGDNTSTSGNVSNHTYASEGLYIVKLTGWNWDSQCVVSSEITVNINKVKAAFKISNDKPCIKDSIELIDESLNGVAWYWFIDNVQKSNSANTKIAFESSGNHTIRLITVNQDNCQDEANANIFVPDIHGDFAIEALSDCHQLTVNFKDQSIADPPIDSWLWDFGDGKSSDQKDPTNLYSTKGNYNVSLTITNTDGACVKTHENAIQFTTPIPNFESTKVNYCPGNQIDFENKTQHAQEFVWSLNGTTVGTNEDLTLFDLAPGQYNVGLIAKDSFGCEVPLIKSNAIIITKPKADFEAFNFYGECPPLSTSFQDKSTGDVNGWFWTFETDKTSDVQHPTHVYVRAGKYDVSLEVTDKFGCKDTKTIEDLVTVGGPSGEIASNHTSICINDTVTYHATALNTAIYRWDTGDGVVEDLVENDFIYPYTSSGKFFPSLVLIDDQGCQVVADNAMEIIVHDTTSLELRILSQCLFEKVPIEMQALADGPMTWEWKLNDHIIGSEWTTSILLDTAGNHQLEIYGTNIHGCLSRLDTIFYVNGEITYFPNIVIPNDDEYNEYLEFTDLHESSWDLTIVNRWGKKVYENGDYQNNWSPQGLASGMYFYVLTNAGCPDKKYKGSLSVR